MSNQVIPAVEAFWTQNKIIIESQLTGTTGSALRAKLGNNFNKKVVNQTAENSKERYYS